MTRFFSEGIGRIRGAIAAVLRPAHGAGRRGPRRDDRRPARRRPAPGGRGGPPDGDGLVGRRRRPGPAVAERRRAVAPLPDFDARLRDRLDDWIEGIVARHPGARPAQAAARPRRVGRRQRDGHRRDARDVHAHGRPDRRRGRRRRGDRVPQPEAARRRCSARRRWSSSSRDARQRLDEALTTTFDEERARFEALLPAPGVLAELAADLRAAAADVRALPTPSRDGPSLVAPSRRADRRGRRTARRAASRRCSRRPMRPTLLGIADRRASRAAHADAARRLGFPSRRLRPRAGRRDRRRQVEPAQRAGGRDVSPASARRPTTSEPVAWVPATEREALGSAARLARASARSASTTRRTARAGRDPRPARHGLDRDRAPRAGRGAPAAGRRRRLGDRPREVPRRRPARRLPAHVAAAARPPGHRRQQGRPAGRRRPPADPARPRGRPRPARSAPARTSRRPGR